MIKPTEQQHQLAMIIMISIRQSNMYTYSLYQLVITVRKGHKLMIFPTPTK